MIDTYDSVGADFEDMKRTRFFHGKPADQSHSAYLREVAGNEARRFGLDDLLVRRYLAIAAYAQKVGA